MNKQKSLFWVSYPILFLSIVVMHVVLAAPSSRISAQLVVASSLEPARVLLREKNLPFEPEALREKGWQKKMRPIFDQIPEMKQVVRHGSRVSGLLLGKNLYFPEKVEFVGDTLIIAENVMFEGLNVELWNAGSLFIFPIKDMGVLGKSLEVVVDDQVAKLSWDQTFEERLNLFNPRALQDGFSFSCCHALKKDKRTEVKLLEP